MKNAYTKVSTRSTPQTQPIPGREADMTANNAGGFSFRLNKWGMLDRFLIMGTEGGTYYVSEQKLTADNAKNLLACIKENGIRVVNRIVEISDAGRAPKNDPALFALAMVCGHGNSDARKAAFESLPKVARIGTHLFHYVQFIEQFRGWGRAQRKAIASWYLNKSPLSLAQQVTKYVQRDGWSHRDLLRLAHPKASNEELNLIFKYIVKGELPAFLLDSSNSLNEALNYLSAVEAVKNSKDSSFVSQKIVEFNLPREVIPTELLNETVVWEALMEQMPLTAMIRNLATMTRVGILGPSSKWVNIIDERLKNVDALKKARIHPIAVLQAIVTYSQGHGMRGTNIWQPVQRIVDALDEAFYLSFGLVVPTGKRFVLGIDVSGSMGGDVSGIMGLSCRTASAAMAMLTARTEKNYHLMGFTNRFVPLAISPRQRLDDIVNYMSRLPFESTDCSLPMLWALKNKVDADVFYVLTDSETYAGSMQPMQALRKYRDSTGIPARLIVSGMTATNISIADPTDAGSLDIAGFDSSVPDIISDFVK